MVVPLLRAMVRDVQLPMQAVSTDWDQVITSFDSATEEDMVQAVRDAGIPAPTQAHVGLPESEPVASADLYYVGEGVHLAVFLDGGVHDGATQQKIDSIRRTKLRDAGYGVVVIRHDDLSTGIEELKQRLDL